MEPSKRPNAHFDRGGRQQLYVPAPWPDGILDDPYAPGASFEVGKRVDAALVDGVPGAARQIEGFLTIGPCGSGAFPGVGLYVYRPLIVEEHGLGHKGKAPA